MLGNLGQAEQTTRKLRGLLRLFVVSLASDMTTFLREKNPVDTGHSRSNWIPQVGSQYSGVAGSKQGVDEGTQLSALAELRRYQGGLVYLTNNVDYIEDLNAGSSPQASPYWVEALIARAIQVVNAKNLSYLAEQIR